MTSKTLSNQSTSGADVAKYALALLLAVAGVFAFYWFEAQWPMGMRLLAAFAGLLLGGVVYLGTSKGSHAREFISESRFELRKVVWPTRQETTRTMWIVVVVVILISLLIAGMDLIIKSGVTALLGN